MLNLNKLFKFHYYNKHTDRKLHILLPQIKMHHQKYKVKIKWTKTRT